MKEPILYFYEKYGFDPRQVKRLLCGEKYVAVVLKNGNLGVCATLGENVELSLSDMANPDTNNTHHRIVLNAYFNALLNYQNQYDTSIDIFDKLDFSKYKNIVMIGFFRSLVKKFENENIPLTIFDKEIADSKLADMSQQLESIGKADAVVMTSTSVFNQSFLSLIKAAGEKSDIFMLGPSTILDREMLNYGNIKVLFGAVFEKNDQRVLDVIKSGNGTPVFAPFMNKVFLK